MTIIDHVEKKFSVNPALKILFFFDDNAKHKDELYAGTPDSFVLLEADHKYFTLKYMLEFELHDKKVLLYFPYSKPAGRDWDEFPLLDLYYANEELLVDDVGQFLDTYHLGSQHKALISRYIDELIIKKNIDRLVSIFNNEELTESKLQHGLIAAFLDLDVHVSSNLCVIKAFSYLTVDKKIDPFLKKLKKYPDLEKEFLKWLRIKLPCEKKIDSVDTDTLILAATILKYNLMLPYAVKPDKHDNYKELKIAGEAAYNNLISLSHEWQDNRYAAPHFVPVIEQVCAMIKTEHLIDVYGTETVNLSLSGSGIKVAVKELFNALLVNPEKSITVAENLINDDVTGSHTDLLNYAIYACRLYMLLSTKWEYVLNTGNQYIDHYTTKGFQIDQLYRKTFFYRGRISGSTHETDISFESIDNELYELYDTHVKKQNIGWQKLLKEKEFSFTNIYKANLQYDFYKNYVKGSNNKIVVIISDALRFEIAEELYQILSSDSKNKVELEPMLSTIPSYTKLGMASLLPNDGIIIKETDGSFDLTIKDLVTNSTDNRRAILQAYNPLSDAITVNDIPPTREKWAELYGDKQVIYIYHNVIDATGDDKKTESETFEFVEVALRNLKELINRLKNFNVATMIVTADHGFLFTKNQIQEPSKEDMPKSDDNLAEHNRFVITKESNLKHEGYQFPLSNTTNIAAGLQVVLPRAVNRFRKSGSGDQFVHGGASLQEVIIPVLKYSRTRIQQKNPVGIRLLSDKLKIVSNVLKISILQENPVNDSYEKITVEIGVFNDRNEQISCDMTLTLDSQGLKAPERERNLEIIMIAGKGKENKCMLKIFDKINDKNRLNPLVEKEVENTTLIERDF